MRRLQLNWIATICIPLSERDRPQAIHIKVVPMDKGLTRLIKRLKFTIHINRLIPARNTQHLFRFLDR